MIVFQYFKINNNPFFLQVILLNFSRFLYRTQVFTLFYAPQECILHFNRLLHYATDTYMLAMVLLHIIQEQSPVWQGNPTF